MSEQKPVTLLPFIESLPDPAGVRVFLERLQGQHPARAESLARRPAILSRLLTIVASSPYLAEAFLRHPEDMDWLEQNPKQLGHTKSAEELTQDLARFCSRISEPDNKARLGRFKIREMARTFLRDCQRIATLSEVTEELSNLADVILRHALKQEETELTRRYGQPLVIDERGRIASAEFSVVSLGKLGCRELNYASDIDLFFLYLGEGMTAGDPSAADSIIDNKTFFTELAQRLTRAVGGKGSGADGAIYRVDLRLRPYGKDGDLVSEVDRAVKYYRERAHNWERQALLRARGSAGSPRTATIFLQRVQELIFRPGDSLAAAPVEHIKRAKEKIDQEVSRRPGGYNVKLGRGGIREIEFIVQALQMTFGGREPWLRPAQTLIVLGRLTEKGLLLESERSMLSAAYTFLRTVEHRLQMENGIQTHSLPLGKNDLQLLARRCGYQQQDDPAAAFTVDLRHHTNDVKQIYQRVVVDRSYTIDPPASVSPKERAAHVIEDIAAALADLANTRAPDLDSAIRNALTECISPGRSLQNLAAWVDSIQTQRKENGGLERPSRDEARAGEPLTPAEWSSFVSKLLRMMSSRYISDILVSRPHVAFEAGLHQSVRSFTRESLAAEMRAVAAGYDPGPAKMDALRRTWYPMIIDIASRELAHRSPTDLTSQMGGLRESNSAQTRLAEAVLDISTGVVSEALNGGQSIPAFAILGLGRLGHAGMDYGSDLDLMIVFADADSAGETMDHDETAGGVSQEFYAHLAASLVKTISSVTGEGYLYRVDLRLRPEGRSGVPAQPLSALLSYTRNRATAWEHSAYLKARPVAGDPAFGALVRTRLCAAIFQSAQKNSQLKEDLKLMRGRLEREKAGLNRPNIKWGPGGMTDVYFVTRYLQLRDSIDFPTERGTTALIYHLGEMGALTTDQAESLFAGYSFLRITDHWLRLLSELPQPVLPESEIALAELVSAIGLNSIEEFQSQYMHHTTAIRRIFDEVFC